MTAPATFWDYIWLAIWCAPFVIIIAASYILNQRRDD
jgi:hypothetical protein